VQEDQIHGADRAVALLGEDQLRQAAKVLAIAVINLLAEDEPDQIGILLDGSRFTQVAELWTVIALSRLHGAAQLREDHHRHVQFLGQEFHAPRKGADFLVAILIAAAAAHQLKVIDNYQPDISALRPQAPQLGVHVHEMDAGHVVDVQGRLGEFMQGVVELAPLVLGEISGTEPLAVDARRRAQHAGEQRFLGHFEREDRHRLFQLQRHVLRHVQG